MNISLNASEALVTIRSDSGEEIVLDVTSYKPATSRLAAHVDIFKPLNGYISEMSKLDKAALFGLYLEAKHVSMTATNEDTLDSKLGDFFRRMFNLVDMNKMASYVAVSSGIKVPREIKATYDEVDAGFLRDKTYIYEEYMQLLTFTLAVRLCFPVWGEYMSKLVDNTTADGREYHAYLLLRRSKLRNHPAYVKLSAYVQASMSSSIETSAPTLVGVGRVNIPEWLTAMVIVRKLPVIDLMSMDNRSNVINAVYSYVDNILTRLTKKFKEDARERRPPSAGAGGEEQECSFIETYRAKQKLTFGDLETDVVYLEGDQLAICMGIDPTFNPDILFAVQEVTDTNQVEPFYLHNHLISQWVLDTDISSLEPDTIPRSSAIAAMTIAQALLHHWGLHTLALMTSGIRLKAGANMENAYFNKLTNDQLEVLDVIYPCHMRGSQRTTSRGKNTNFGYLTIMEMSKTLVRYKYAVRTPSFLTTDDVPVDRFGHLRPPPSISHEIYQLFVKLDEITPEPINYD